MSVMELARQRAADLLVGTVTDNPVVVREFRTRMRGWKAFAVIGGYVLLMAAVMLITYYAMAQANSQSGYGPSQYVQDAIGRDLFVALTWAQTILLALVIPALSSGAITQELEKKTIEMIALSPLSAGRIVVGKQLSYFTYALILLACSLPLSGICVMLGGISPAEIFVTYLLLASWAFLLTCAGLLCSSLAKKTATASGNNYGLSILYLIGTASSGAAISFSHYYGITTNPFALLCPAWAPFAALESTEVCGIMVSLAAVAFLTHVAYGALFLLIASTHIRYKTVERALPIRLLLLGITVFSTWLTASNYYAAPNPKATLSSTGISLLVQSVIAAAIFASGVVKKPKELNMLEYALSGRRAFKTDIGGAITFVTLWAAVSYVAYGIANFWAMKSAGKPLPSDFWAMYAQVGIAVICISAAITAIAVLGSCFAKKRGTAISCLVLFALIAFAIYPVIMVQQISQPMPNPHSVINNLAIFWPPPPILQASDQWPKYYGKPPWGDAAWLITSMIYLVIGAIALSLASSAYKKTGGVVADE